MNVHKVCAEASCTSVSGYNNQARLQILNVFYWYRSQNFSKVFLDAHHPKFSLTDM